LQDITATLSEAKQHHLAGRLAEAEAAYRRALYTNPNLGDIWYYLGRACLPLGKTDEAIACYQQAITLRPGFVEAYSNLGIALKIRGQLEEAINCYRRAIQIRPEYLEAHLNLGNALETQGKAAESIARYQFVISQNPQFTQAHHNLGLAFKNQRAWNEALACLRESVRLDPQFAQAHANLASVLAELRQDDEALASYQRALDLEPNLILALCGRVNLLVRQEAFDAAQMMLEAAIKVQPNSAELHGSLGFVLCEQGLLAAGLDHYRHSLELDPNCTATWSNYLYHCNYNPNIDSTTLCKLHSQGAKTLEQSQSPKCSQTIEPLANRPLRVGYVSPDFRKHAVASFFEPILANHDRKRVLPFCYSDVATPDNTTIRLRASAHAWRDIRPLTDNAVEQMIRADQLDLLVDLAGHTARNRLKVFARKPAPVQITYLGYPGTTGLLAIDGLLTDAIIDPPDRPRSSIEEPIRINSTFCCYAPPPDAGDVAPLPMLNAGFPTFGSLHKLPKLNDQVINLWSKLLLAVPSARLLLFRDRLKGHRGQQILQHFMANGVAPDRVLIQHNWDMRTHWDIYASIDLSLDAFPWSGHTTACESLWMGVPIVTLTGDTRPSRMTASVLGAIGLTDLIASSPDQYIEIAAAWVVDPKRLAQTRAVVREQLRASRLCDGAAFTRDLESAYEAFYTRRMFSKT
jgi:protein O-GlcNAc transferase